MEALATIMGCLHLPAVENHSGVFKGTEGGTRLSSQQRRELVGRSEWVA